MGSFLFKLVTAFPFRRSFYLFIYFISIDLIELLVGLSGSRGFFFLVVHESWTLVGKGTDARVVEMDNGGVCGVDRMW